MSDETDHADGVPGGVTRANAARLIQHPQAAHALREAAADGPFFYRDVKGDIDNALFREFAHNGVLHHADDHQIRVRLDNGTRSDAWRWTLTQGAAEWIAAHVPEPAGGCPVAECYASGIRNLGGGRYTCSNDDCDSRFDRSTAAEVLGR